jgi:hypothetical protein
VSIIRRVNRPADDFTMIRNEFVRDDRLSFKARGLGAWLMSHAAGWETSAAAIAKACGCGREQVRTALLELERHRYLRRVQERTPGGTLGQSVYEVQCTPFDEESPGGDRDPVSRRRLVRPRETEQHKKTTSKKTTQQQKNTPSGGATADAAPRSLEPSPIHEQRQEDAVAPPAETLALFDPPPSVKAQKPREPSAGTVVAAFVDAYRKAHSGADPVKAAIGRVARDAKMLIETGRAAPQELEKAATEMGGTSYNNLPVSLDKLREAPKRGRQGAVPASPFSDPHWQEIAVEQDRQWYQDLLTDDESIRWARRDQSEVDKLIARYPELAARFRDVA